MLQSAIVYARRALGLTSFLALPVIAWMWIVSGLGFTDDHGIPQLSRTTGIDQGFLECAATTMEAGSSPGRLAFVGFTFEPLYHRDDAFIVRTLLQRTVVDITEDGAMTWEPRFGDPQTIRASCPDGLAASDDG